MIALAIVLSYLLGSMPTGLWLGLRIRGVDIRQSGSHNIGATNTFRVLGKGLGAAALVGDILKGVIPVLLIARLSGWEHAPLACGLAAILGHVTSPFVRFRGGKGVATSTGVFLSLAPIPTLIAAAAFLLVFLATRMVSASSIVAAVVLSTLMLALPGYDPMLRILTVIVALLVLFRHHSNIRRILTGTENRL
jgi:glycerol-3-phosphate acyltransferase PlsY